MSETHAHSEAMTAHTPVGDHPWNESPFTDAEWQSLRSSDMAAARAVVTLLLGVFLMGVVIYTIVCVAVSS